MDSGSITPSYQLTTFEFASPRWSLLSGSCSFAVLLAVQPLARIELTVRPHHLTLAVSQVVALLSLVCAAVRPRESAVAVSPSLRKLALVSSAICPLVIAD